MDNAESEIALEKIRVHVDGLHKVIDKHVAEEIIPKVDAKELIIIMGNLVASIFIKFHAANSNYIGEEISNEIIARMFMDITDELKEQGHNLNIQLIRGEK